MPNSSENPINGLGRPFDTEYSIEDGTLALSWSSLPREKVRKVSRKERIKHAFENEFLSGNNTLIPLLNLVQEYLRVII